MHLILVDKRMPTCFVKTLLDRKRKVKLTKRCSHINETRRVSKVSKSNWWQHLDYKNGNSILHNDIIIIKNAFFPFHSDSLCNPICRHLSAKLSNIKSFNNAFSFYKISPLLSMRYATPGNGLAHAGYNRYFLSF